MLSPQALLRGIVSRLLPTVNPDNTNQDVGWRMGRYGEGTVLSYVRKSHLLADEGTYFVTNNAQTGIATPAVASFGATTPVCVIQNTDSSGGKRIYLDYATLVTTAAGSWASGGTNLQIMVYLDTGLRYSSGGTNLTPNIVSPNMDISTAKSVAGVYFGNITASAASTAVRAICGLRIVRPAASATAADVVGEQKVFNFGGVEAAMQGAFATVTAVNLSTVQLPPIVIGPQQSCLIYYVMNGTTPSAASYAPEIGWWER